MSEDPPKQELLLKLLKMTTSDNDGEALIAIRKANDLLRSASWDWDKLIHTKIRVIADPFTGPANIPTPTTNGSRFSAPTPPPKPAPAHGYGGGGGGSAAPRSPQQSTPPPNARKPVIQSINSNRYAGWCYSCGRQVDQRSGFIFNPSTINRRAPDKWMIACTTCNDNATAIPPSPAARAKSFQPGLGDI